MNVSVDGCLSLYVSPAMNRPLVQGVPPPLPKGAEVGSPNRISYRKWMDGWMKKKSTYVLKKAWM